LPLKITASEKDLLFTILVEVRQRGGGGGMVVRYVERKQTFLIKMCVGVRAEREESLFNSYCFYFYRATHFSF
jgi:hypothetical protein